MSESMSVLWEATPFESVGPLRFDMDREAVRRTLGVEFKTVDRRGRENLSDIFSSLLVLVHYRRETGTIELIEIVGGGIDVRAQGRRLFDHSTHDLLVWLHVADPEFSGNMGSWASPRFGLGLYAPAWEEEPERPPSGVSFSAATYA